MRIRKVSTFPHKKTWKRWWKKQEHSKKCGCFHNIFPMVFYGFLMERIGFLARSKPPRCLFFVHRTSRQGDEILPSYKRSVIYHAQDPYEPTSIMGCDKGLEHCSVDMENIPVFIGLCTSHMIFFLHQFRQSFP